MSYNPNIPAATDIISQSQGQIQTNFEQANDIFGVNHVPFSPTSSTQGYHAYLNFPAAVSPPSRGAGVSVLYPNTDAFGNVQLYYKNAGNSGWPITGPYGSSSNSTSFNGFVYVPGKIIINYGYYFPNSGSITFPVTWTFQQAYTNAPPYVMAIGARNNGTTSVISVGTGSNAPTTTTATFTSAGGGYTGIYWLAIGT